MVPRQPAAGLKTIGAPLKSANPLARLPLVLLTLATAPALAEDLPANGAQADGLATLAPVVVTAAGFEQKLTDAPASISVVSREELTRRPYLSLVDAVADLEGVDVGETSDRKSTRLNSSHVKI